MRRVTRSGTAAGRFDTLPFGVAGKTGTAQNDQYDRMSHSWFIGFAPVEHPRIAIAVIAENGGYGASVAVPVARDVLRAAGR
jgi:cell division protein FtsI/penicillin-binding protein 2